MTFTRRMKGAGAEDADTIRKGCAWRFAAPRQQFCMQQQFMHLGQDQGFNTQSPSLHHGQLIPPQEDTDHCRTELHINSGQEVIVKTQVVSASLTPDVHQTGFINGTSKLLAKVTPSSSQGRAFSRAGVTQTQIPAVVTSASRDHGVVSGDLLWQ